MKRNAKRALNLPQSKRSGTNINSSVFITAITAICEIALIFDHLPLNIQIHMAISEIPISRVNVPECSFPMIRPTISRCLGTRLSTLQIKPLISHTNAMSHVSIWCIRLFILYNCVWTKYLFPPI
jgi:hypothetical protein